MAQPQGADDRDAAADEVVHVLVNRLPLFLKAFAEERIGRRPFLTSKLKMLKNRDGDRVGDRSVSFLVCARQESEQPPQELNVARANRVFGKRSDGPHLFRQTATKAAEERVRLWDLGPQLLNELAA